ncbi:prepilin-type N-terminal cleavage/methylation domain-containing protein [Candidatus Daviesbacteria bacterium]|nr:prepilin-type N-terminal cleavage/methylation domain-containing protein [Candidatus Daviesbacteria bacterium]
MRQKGLTLIELFVAMGIASVVGVLLLVIIVSSAGVFYKESSKLTEGLNINDTLSKVRETIKQSSAIIVLLTQGGDTYTSGATEIVFKVPAIDSSNNILANTFDYFVFFLDSNKLRFRTFPDALSFRKAQDQIFSTSVDSLHFQYYDLANPPVEVIPINAAKVKITLTLKQKNGLNYEKTTATSEANLRNL